MARVREFDPQEAIQGAMKVFWRSGYGDTTMEDIVNQSDTLEDIDEEDKLGQPMINLDVQKDWGRLDLFVLPSFRERACCQTQPVRR